MISICFIAKEKLIACSIFCSSLKYNFTRTITIRMICIYAYNSIIDIKICRSYYTTKCFIIFLAAAYKYKQHQEFCYIF